MIENYMKEPPMIMVICEVKDAGFWHINFELLGKARSLAEKNNAMVGCIAVGAKEPEDFIPLFQHGAQYILYNNLEGHYNYWMAARLVCQGIKKCSPRLVIFPGMGMYKMIASTAAYLTGSGLTADCIDITYNDQWEFVFKRTAMNASIMAEIVCQGSQVRMCTVKQNVFHGFVRGGKTEEGKSEYLLLSESDIYSELIEPIDSQPAQVQQNSNLQQAKLVIAIGRGVEISDYEEVRAIADMLNAEIGCTRTVVEAGLLPKSQQIGQSGVAVSPVLYLALGISGASQHIVGMQGAKKIIAVNKDEKAPIFNYCDCAIISDCHSAIVGLKEQLSKNLRWNVS